MCTTCYRLMLLILGIAQWQKELDKVDKIMIEEKSPAFNGEIFS